MPQRVEVPVADLLLDEKNARLGQEMASQQDAALALARQQGRRLVRLAQDVAERGLDPSQLPSIVATGDKPRRRYTVIEGNRRVLAVKALETPSLVQPALSAGDFKKLQAAALKFAANPIEEIACVLFASEEFSEAYGWVIRRHTGQQDGAGLVEWSSDEKDRFAARHGSSDRGMAGQVLDFLEAIDGRSNSPTKVSTTLTRLLSTPEVRHRLGIDRVGNEIISWYPKDEVVKGIRRVLDDLRGQRVGVKDLYTAKDRRDYAEDLKQSELPKKSTKLADPVKLVDLSAGKRTPAAKKPAQRRRPKPKTERTAVAAPGNLSPQAPRLNAIYNELLALSADTFPNAGSVLLRVFLELAIDDYIDRHNVMTPAQKGNAVLAKRMKEVALHLETAGEIDLQLKKAVVKIADAQHTLAASIMAFHQYVHNQYVHPKPSELRTSWNELQPFLEAVLG